MNELVPSNPKMNVYQTVTQKIVAALEAGAGTFKTPWHVTGPSLMLPANAATHAEYRGINVLMLWLEAMERGYESGLWASYRQWKSLDAQVRKNERGALIIFYKRTEVGDQGAEGETRQRFFARASWVFNAAQVEGFGPPIDEQRPKVDRIAEAEAFVAATNATIRHGCPMACYNRKLDIIEMPLAERFTGTDTSTPTEAYYGVLLHELTHWSGAPPRLNREFGKRFGDEAYAMEELVAELGAAFLCAAFGIASEPRPDHAAYLSSWLTVLKKDNRAIFTAASKAQEAAEYLRRIAEGNSSPVCA